MQCLLLHPGKIVGKTKIDIQYYQTDKVLKLGPNTA